MKVDTTTTLAYPGTVSQESVIDRMRAMKPADVEKPTVPQVRTIVNGLSACHSLEDIAKDAFGPVFSTEEHYEAMKRTLDTVSDFGVWLTHVNGGAGAEVSLAVDQNQMVLFQTPDLAESTIRPAAVKRGKKLIPFDELSAIEQAAALRLPEIQREAVLGLTEEFGEAEAKAKIEEILESRERRAAAVRTGRSAKTQAKIAKAQAEANKVIVPAGFERKAFHKRDVAKALAAIVVADPDDDTIGRFIARKYQAQAKVLTFPHLTELWFFAKMGRLDEYDRINPKNPVFAELSVEAYDLLDVARRDAVAGIEVLAKGDVKDLPALREACQKSLWLAEGEVRRIAKLVETTMTRPSSERLLERELSFFAQRVARETERYKPAALADLNLGHLTRIALNAGLEVDNDDRSDEAEIREALKKLGFHTDLDRLVPAGVKAARAGRRDEFFEVMSARKGGNNEWHLLLDELFETIGA